MENMRSILIALLVGSLIIGMITYFAKQPSENEVAQEQINLEENEIYAVVTNNDEGNVETEYNNNIYTFYSNADSKNVVEDDIVKISFKGELQDNMQPEKITAIKEVMTTKEEIEIDANKEYYITGTVTNIKSDVITIKANIDDENYYFNVSEIKDNLNIVVGNNIAIVYKGIISQNNEEPADAISLKKIDINKNENLSKRTISGKIEKIYNNVITMKVDDKTYAFLISNISNAEVVVNNTVTITYKGKLSENAINRAIEIEQ